VTPINQPLPAVLIIMKSGYVSASKNLNALHYRMLRAAGPVGIIEALAIIDMADRTTGHHTAMRMV
jgi:hypothetical protein